MKIVVAHDLPSNVPGKTWKELNMEKQHKYPIGSLVELRTEVRLFVVKHVRDCDGTPLYVLTWEPEWTDEDQKEFPYERKCDGGYGEDFMKLIRQGEGE